MGACQCTETRSKENPNEVRLLSLKDSSISPHVFTFSVDPVVISTKKPELVTPEVAFRMKSKCQLPLEEFSHKKKTKKCIVPSNFSGFMTAVHFAYANHYHLRLSVSDFIILIAQGLAHHLNNHAELIKGEFLELHEKEPILVHRHPSTPGNDDKWVDALEDTIEDFKRQIKKAEVLNIVTDNTAVGTKVSKIVSQITLMDQMKQSVQADQEGTQCGIPKLTLKGSPEDWKKLKEKVYKLKEINELDKYMLDWWLKYLLPVIDIICEEGMRKKSDGSFWRKFYKQENGSGGPFIQGWVNVFNPYVVSSCGIYKNECVDWEKRLDDPMCGITTAEITSGVSEVPFLLDSGNGEQTPMKLYAGFLGAKFYDDSSIEPEHFWAIVNAKSAE